MQTAVAKKQEENKSTGPASAPASEHHVDLKAEDAPAPGTPIYLRSSKTSAAPPPVQRQPDDEEPQLELAEEEEPLPSSIQPKLIVGPPDDEYEREADDVAERVQRMPDTRIDQALIEEDEELSADQPEAIQMKPLTPRYLQRLCAECNEELEQPRASVHSSPIQTKADGVTTAAPSSHVSKTVSSSSGGSPLAGNVKAKVEPVLGHDLGHVRVHTDSNSHHAARDLGAKAFTHQNHIWLGAGQSPTDESLIAHEATHTVQQRGANTDSLIQRDALDQSITPTYGMALNDGDLMYEIQLIEERLSGLDSADETRESLSGNLDILRAEYNQRDPGANATGFQDVAISSTQSGFAGLIPEGGEDVGKVGVVAWDGEPQLRLRTSPDTSTTDNIITTLPLSTQLQVIKQFPGNWYFVSTPNGDLGYVASNYIFMDLPEPNARLHRVEAGLSGSAIAIAERYYSEYADDWGQDLRFYINVLAWVNNIDVPNTTAGWRSVHFQSGQLIWIPSQQFAYSLKGVVNSGSYSYNIADFIGIADFIERVGQLWDDFRRAVSLSKQYIGESVTRHLEESLLAMAEGLAYLLLGAVAILAISTAVGAAIGALAGGVGAAPGAAAGFEVGMVIIEWLGLGLLLYWIGESLLALGGAFGKFLGTVWDARGDEKILERGAREFADAIGLLIAKIFEAILMFLMAKGIPKGLKAIRGTRLGKALGESRVARWVAERSKAIESGEALLPGPRQVAGRIRGTGRAGAEPAPVTRSGQTQYFHELPPERLPSNLPEGHFWMRDAAGEWVLMREAGAPEVPFELSVYSDGAGNTNYVLRSGDRMIQSDALTREGSVYERGQQRLPEELEGTGAINPYRDPLTGELYDKGHGVDYADTLEGPGVRSSTTDPANFSPQASWWNRGPRNTLVGRIRNGHVASGRPGGGGYREMAIYGENPPVTANGTPIPREFVFVETNRAGVAQRAWRIPNQPGAGTRSMSALDGRAMNLSEVPPVLLRTNVPMQAHSSSMTYAPFVIFGVLGDDEAGENMSDEGAMCVDESAPLPANDAPVVRDWCE